MKKHLLLSGLLATVLCFSTLMPVTADIYMSKRIFDTDIHTMKTGDSKVITMASTQIIGNYFMTWGESGLSMTLDGMYLNCQANVSNLKMAAGQGGWSFWHLLELTPKDPDAIKPQTADVQSETLFDLQGRLVTDDRLQPGLYIKKGKKFLVK